MKNSTVTTARALPMPFRVLALILALALFPTCASAQTLKIATIAPEGSAWMNDMRAGGDEIAERTAGRVSLKFYGGGVQGNDRQVQRKMRTGQLHGGAFTSGSMNKFQRDADIYALPLLFHSLDEVRFVREELDAELRERLAQAGYVTFGFAGAGFAYMMANQPMRSLADLDGQKVWTPEGDAFAFAALRSLGVAPVSMPVTDVMTGLQTDLLDSVAVPPVGAIVLQWHTRLKYITDLPISYTYAGIMLERRAFERLQENDQAVVREVLEGIYRRFDESGTADNRQALQALLDSGLELVEPEPDEVRSWRENVLRSHQQQVAKDVIDPQLYARLLDLLATYRSKFPGPATPGGP
ncbi:TRAP transporter substrate-binding protein DctP [Elongatibacter sediminis]|uniref:TRAP transporter substrate-binding protein DctP n=1 Tax=Elongatibacter sediminis TaxID=3119006 RepID=A0AAW9R5A2_9GAMM